MLIILTELYPTRKIHGADPGRLVNPDTVCIWIILQHWGDSDVQA